MATTVNAYALKLRGGRYEDAKALLAEIKASATRLGAQQVRLHYASAAGKAADALILTVEYASAADAGVAADKGWVDSKANALADRVAAPDGPVQLISNGTYTEVEF